jgi:hypothetical protein
MSCARRLRTGWETEACAASSAAHACSGQLDGGGSTANATIRRTSGSTASKVGNATSHDIAHAAGHVVRKIGVGPRLFSVEIAETTKVISTDNTSGMTIAA